MNPKIKPNFEIERKEYIGLILTSIAFAFIVSFRKWGTNTFNLGAGISNLIFAFIIIILSLLAHIVLQKLVGIKLGYKVHYSYWPNGLLISILLAFLSFGYVWLLLPGAVMLEHVTKMRLGKFRFGVNKKDLVRVGFAGPLVHLVIVMFLSIIYKWFSQGYIHDMLFFAILINLALAICSLLPIPKIDMPHKSDSAADGLHIFFFNRTLWVFIFAVFIVYALLIIWNNMFSLITSIILGVLITVIYIALVEPKD